MYEIYENEIWNTKFEIGNLKYEIHEYEYEICACLLVARCGWLANSAALCLISQSFAIFHRHSKIKIFHRHSKITTGTKFSKQKKCLAWNSLQIYLYKDTLSQDLTLTRPSKMNVAAWNTGCPKKNVP